MNAAQTAKLIRKAIREAAPNARFTVSTVSGHYIHTEFEDETSAQVINQIVSRFASDAEQGTYQASIYPAQLATS